MDFEQTEQYLKDKIAELKLPYVEVLVKKDGKECFCFKYAESDKDNDMLCMYSMSKPITAVCLLKLVEEGKVNLSDPISKYLNGYDDLYILKSDTKIEKPITISNLLSMTSGLDYNFGRKAIRDLAQDNPNADTVALVETFAKDGLLFEPGTSFNYSLSIDVIAGLIQKVTNTKFSDYVYENVFKPLEMNKSTFAYNQNLANQCREEYTNFNSNLGATKRLYYIFFPTTKFESGGAGLLSTVEDYSKFIDSLANRKQTIIKDESVNKMASVIVSETPFSKSVSEFSKSNIEYGYGYGVRVRKIDSINNIPAGEFGWDGAAGSYSLCDRKNHISIVVGLTIHNWPSYVNDFHIALANQIYKDLKIEK